MSDGNIYACEAIIEYKLLLIEKCDLDIISSNL